MNGGFINWMKLLKVHQTLCQTVLNTEKKVQLFTTSEFKEYFYSFVHVLLQELIENQLVTILICYVTRM